MRLSAPRGPRPPAMSAGIGLDPMLHSQLSDMGECIGNLLQRSARAAGEATPEALESPREATSMSTWAAARSHPADVVLVDPGPLCARCTALSMQVRALSQALAGLGARAFNWSAGMGKVQRRDLSELVLAYLRPCAHLDAGIDDICAELERIRWVLAAAPPTVRQPPPPPKPGWTQQPRWPPAPDAAPRSATRAASLSRSMSPRAASTSLLPVWVAGAPGDLDVDLWRPAPALAAPPAQERATASGNAREPPTAGGCRRSHSSPRLSRAGSSAPESGRRVPQEGPCAAAGRRGPHG